jgi:hypothetical protein
MRPLVAVACAALLIGCASMETVKAAKGQGIKRTFRQPYDIVFQSVLNSAIKRKLELIEQNRATGSVLLSSGASWTSLGERIAVFVSRNGARSTTVEIVSRPVLSGITLPPDWPGLLYGDIEHELAAVKRPR